MPGADCGTDHELLVATIQVKLKKTKKLEIENRYNSCDIPERYAVEVKNRFAALDLIYTEPEELWKEVEAIVKDEAKNNITKSRKPKKSKWDIKDLAKTMEGVNLCNLTNTKQRRCQNMRKQSEDSPDIAC